MKIGQLNMHCGNCGLIDYCGEPYSDICICAERRFAEVEEDKFYELAETSKEEYPQEIIDDVFKRL